TRMEELLDVLRVQPGKKIDLKKDYDPGFTGKWMNKEEAKETLAEGIRMLAEMQDKLWARTSMPCSWSFRRFCCKKSSYFTKPVKNITNGIFICHKQINNKTKSNSYSLKRQKNYFCNGTQNIYASVKIGFIFFQ
ncbi:MAG TPA: hypothetical protein VIL99_09415, partial [Ignavibacteria bacterium]